MHDLLPRWTTWDASHRPKWKSSSVVPSRQLRRCCEVNKHVLREIASDASESLLWVSSDFTGKDLAGKVRNNKITTIIIILVWYLGVIFVCDVCGKPGYLAPQPRFERLRDKRIKELEEVGMGKRLLGMSDATELRINLEWQHLPIVVFALPNHCW